jgi:hypothetical protein
VDEHILATISCDETKALRIIEPLDRSGLTTHLRISFLESVLPDGEPLLVQTPSEAFTLQR